MLDIGKRIHALRLAQHMTQAATGFSHGWVCRVERGGCIPSLAAVEELCDRFDVGPATLLCSDEQFEEILVIQDEFCRQVQPFLKSLNAEQKAYILKVLEAAPKQKPWDGRQRYGATRRAT